MFIYQNDIDAAQQKQTEFEREHEMFMVLAQEAEAGSPTKKIYDIMALQYAVAAQRDVKFKSENWSKRELAMIRGGDGLAVLCKILAYETPQLTLRGFIEGKAVFRTLINPEAVTSKQLRRATRDRLKVLTPDEIYRAAYMTGNQEILDGAISTQPSFLPDDMVKQYPAWKAKNTKFIKEAESHVISRETTALWNDDAELIKRMAEYLVYLRDRTDVPEQRAFYSLYIHLQNSRPFCIANGIEAQSSLTAREKGVIDENPMLFFCEYVVCHHKSLDDTSITYARSLLRTWLATPRELLAKTISRLDTVSQAIRICGLENAPDIDWDTFNALFKLAQDVGQKAEGKPVITHIDVDYDMVVSGKADKGMGYMSLDERHDDDQPPLADDNENRTQKLEDWLASIPQSHISLIETRRCTRVQTDDGRKRKPYNLIDIHMNGGEIIRIAVCDYRAHQTFIERGASPYIDNQVLEISSLRKNDRVWTAIHFTDTQWFEKLRGRIFTPVGELQVEDKNRSAWFSLKGELVSSFAATVMATGNLPFKASAMHFQYGPLAGKTTIRRAFSAAYEGRVDGIPEGTTFNKLFDLLAKGNEAPMPQLQRFLNKPPITDDMILNACTRFRQDFGAAVEPSFFELLVIDPVDARAKKEDADLRRHGMDADFAIKAGAVHIAPEKISAWGRYPYGLQDYLELEEIIPVTKAPSLAAR